MTKYKRLDKDRLKSRLSELEYKVTQEGGTEPPYKNKYHNNFEEGIYVDITSGEALFISTDKFESGCGWPAFSKPITREVIREKRDRAFGMERVEVRAKNSDSHLGHVFNDGPLEKGGLRYCINSASLNFIPMQDMEKEGYGEYLDLLN